jgi:predicted dinucleotide-binding enzyme
VPWASVPDALAGLQWNGQIVIDATNDFDPRDLDGRRRARSSPTSSAMHQQ